jgi:uncharacterized protein YndB with AHSA1/START domain
MDTDRIEKRVLLRATRARVWRAVSVAESFGAWFGVEFDGPFVAGARLGGRIVPTTVDPEVAKRQSPHAGKSFEFRVDSIEPMHRLSFRWHPFAVDPGVDYREEPTTLVVFELHEAPDGILLVISESGFDALPPSRRAAAFRANDGGWALQATLVAKYLAAQAAA